MKTPVVLLAISDRVMLSMLRQTLAKEGYYLLPARNGRDALEIVEEHDVNLILADERLPDMSGMQLLDRVRMAYPATLTMMLTSTNDINVARAAQMNVGIYKFFLKPCSPKHIRMSIRKCLRPARESHRCARWGKDTVASMLRPRAYATA